MKTRENSFLSIKSKLTAAVAMLLVAFFMVISSSYAWFTLSTAPEVTGIYTAVGANGNLEIALYTGTDITSNVGDSAYETNKTFLDSNKTWGNLVNLGAKDADDNNIYGLDKISLLPAVLNLEGNETDGYTLKTAYQPLKTPVYQADGKISALEANTSTGVYSEGAFAANENAYGVRAIGTQSGMSAQEIAWRTARADINSATNAAVAAAKNSLSANANSLASMLITKAADSAGTATYDIQFVDSIISGVTTANDKIAEAIVAYVKAAAAKAGETLDETNYKLVETAVSVLTITQISVTTASNATGYAVDVSVSYNDGTANQTSISIPVGRNVYEAYSIYTSNKNAIQDANAYLNGGTLVSGTAATEVNSKTAATWTEVHSVLIDSGLVNIDNMTVNGSTADELKDDMSKLVAAVSTGITVQMPAGSGVYADIAEVCGNYTVKDVTITITEEQMSNFGITMDGGMEMAAQMATTVSEHWDMYTEIGTAGLPNVDSANQSVTITDYYGYAIDLAFRTNAADSYLMLQTSAVNRIYTEGGSDETMGKGSTMTFTVTEGFTTQQAAELIKSIRIVFVDSKNKIVAIGALDAAEAIVSGNDVKANVYLYNFTVGTNNSIILGDKVADNATKDGEQQQLMALTQNEQVRLSAYVYLDGENVGNDDVANAATSMTGSLNLQFSSSATLIPMEYSDLQGVQTTDPNADPNP